MEMLDRYLYEAEKYLRKKDREIVLEKIRVEVMEKVNEKTSSGSDESMALREALVEVGSPLEMARKVDPEIGYVIGPKLFQIYRMVIGFSIMGISIAFVTILVIQLSFNQDVKVGMALLEMVGQIFTTALSVVGSVTIVFYIIQKYFSQDAFSDEEWNPDELPELPKKVERINRTGAIIGLAILIVIVFIFNFYPEMIGVFFSTNGGPLVFESLLSAENISPYLIVLNPLWFLAVASKVYSLVKGKRTLTSQLIFSIAMTGIFLTVWVMLGDIQIMENTGEWVKPFSASLRMGIAAGAIVFAIDTIRQLILFKRFSK